MRTTLLIAILGAALAAVACSGSAATTASSPASAAASASSTTASASAAAASSPSVPPEGSSMPSDSPTPTGTARFTIHSSAFDDGAAIPRRFTCDGEDVSPDIAWSGAPTGTVALALIVRDPDAGGFVHWIAYDIPGAPEGTLPNGMSAGPAAVPQGRNSFGRIGWSGPCPPSGTHHYVFSLSALDRTLGLTGTPGLADVESAMRGHVIAEATLTGTYKRG